VQIRFRSRKLEKQYTNSKQAEIVYGEAVARKYIQRIQIMKRVKNLDELCTLPSLRCHPLKGNRKGQWAVNLTASIRLIFTPEGDFLEIACIEEVSKHYDD